MSDDDYDASMELNYNVPEQDDFIDRGIDAVANKLASAMGMGGGSGASGASGAEYEDWSVEISGREYIEEELDQIKVTAGAVTGYKDVPGKDESVPKYNVQDTVTLDSSSGDHVGGGMFMFGQSASLTNTADEDLPWVIEVEVENEDDPYAGPDPVRVEVGDEPQGTAEKAVGMAGGLVEGADYEEVIGSGAGFEEDT